MVSRRRTVLVAPPLHHSSHAAMVMVGLAGFLFRCFRDASFRRDHQAGDGSGILQGDADDLGGIDDAHLVSAKTASELWQSHSASLPYADTRVQGDRRDPDSTRSSELKIQVAQKIDDRKKGEPTKP